jgi:ABC-type bacteriocin/lantibiotic exporter with double-glycine peptidase domain
MVSLVGRSGAHGARGSPAGMRRSIAGTAEPGNSLALAFEQLCAQLKRPFSSAEIKAAAPPAEAGMTLGGILLAAERLGFKARQVKPKRRALAQMPTPFLLIGHRPGEGWLVRARVRDHLVLVDPTTRRESVTSLESVADLAWRVVLLKPAAETASRQQQWRDPIMRRLRPVLWELGIASIVINVMALATPLFLMTVYNTGDVHPAPYRAVSFC